MEWPLWPARSCPPILICWGDLQALPAPGLGIGLFEHLHLLQHLVPATLQGAGHQAVLGLDRIELACGALRLIAGALQLQLPLPVQLLGVRCHLVEDRHGQVQVLGGSASSTWVSTAASIGCAGTLQHMRRWPSWNRRRSHW